MKRVTSLTYSRLAVTAICGVAVGLALGAPCARADQWDKRTVITLNQPIQVRDRLLEPGTYVFRLLNSASDRYTVQIFNGDQTRIIDTVFAIPSYRLRPPDKSEFTFWETPAGTARRTMFEVEPISACTLQLSISLKSFSIAVSQKS